MSDAVVVGVIAAGGAIVGSAVTGLITYRVTNRQVLAEDRRLREARLAETYVDLVRMVHTAMAQVEQTRPRVHLSPASEPPPSISFDEEAAIKARLEAFGSHPVREAFVQWRGSLNFFKLAVGELDNLAGGPGLPRPEHVSASDWSGISNEMTRCRDSMRASTLEVEQLVRDELDVASALVK